MPNELVVYILKYGYIAIFILVFSQEIGLPNPIPNELVLVFSGYLIFLGLLKIPLVILAVVLADFTGTGTLYLVFYFSGAYILKHKPRWLPIPIKGILKLQERISKNRLTGIYVGRLTPFIRGYTSVIAGLLQIKPKVFAVIALVTATVWASFYVSAGILLGPFWNHIAPNVKNFRYIMLLIFSTILFIVILRALIRRWTVKN